MSIEFVRPFTHPNFEHIQAMIDTNEIVLYSSRDDDWFEVTLTDAEYGAAMRVMLSLEFDSYIEARIEAEYAYERAEEFKAEIIRDLDKDCTDVETIASLVNSIQYWSECRGKWETNAIEARYKVRNKIGGHAWRNVCHLYASLYDCCYADVERVF